MLSKICKIVWEQEQILEDCQIKFIVPIYKKGERNDWNNYRGIMLLIVAMEVSEKNISQRI